MAEARNLKDLYLTFSTCTSTVLFQSILPWPTHQHFFFDLILSGNAGHFDGEVSPLRYLEMAAEWFATAIKLSPKRADLHFQLGQVLEEQHYVQDLYGIKPPVSWLILKVLAVCGLNTDFGDQYR